MFLMQKAYEGMERIDTEDLLTALKYALNYEADLYMDGKLICSPLGLSWEENLSILKKYGIVSVGNKRYRFAYADESKNVNKIFASINEYIWNNEKCVDVRLNDYRQRKEDIEFSTKKELLEYLKQEIYPKFDECNLHITSYMGDECEHWDKELKVIEPYYKLVDMKTIDISLPKEVIELEDKTIFIHHKDLKNGYIFVSDSGKWPSCDRLWKDDKGIFFKRLTGSPNRIYLGNEKAVNY